MNKKIWIIAAAAVLALAYWLFVDSEQEKINAEKSSSSVSSSSGSNDTPSTSNSGIASTETAVEEQKVFGGEQEKAEKASAKTKEVDLQQIASVVDPNTNVVVGESMAVVMAASNYHELVSGIRLDKQISISTDKYQQDIQYYLTDQDALNVLQDYQINCNDSFCLGYFVSAEPEALAKVNNVLLSENSPLHFSGFSTEYLTVNAQGTPELRMIFNSDPKLDAIEHSNRGPMDIVQSN